MTERLDMLRAEGNERLAALIQEMSAELEATRAELATAHEHIGALVAAIDELDGMGEWVWSGADDKTLLSIHLTEPHHTELTDLMLAARAWLRREARP